MGMSTHIIAFRPPDKEWLEMKQVYDACLTAGIDIPGQVEAFFGGDRPDDSGVRIDISLLLEEWQEESRQGYQLDLSKLPDGIKILRFYNSW